MDNLRRNGNTQHTRQMTSTKETASSWQTGYIDVHLTFLFQNRREETLCQGTTVVMYSALHSSLPIALPDKNIYMGQVRWKIMRMTYVSIHRQMYFGPELFGTLSAWDLCPRGRNSSLRRLSINVKPNGRKTLQYADEHIWHFIVCELYMISCQQWRRYQGEEYRLVVPSRYGDRRWTEQK